MATTLKQEFELIEQDQDNATAAFKALCKARMTLHRARQRHREQVEQMLTLERLDDSPDGYISYQLYWAREESGKAVCALRDSARAYEAAEQLWLEAA